MTRLDWSAVGSRFYEMGVDRGVLYVSGEAHAWTGLISVAESPSGGDPRPYYIDGVKYLNLSTAEEFEATITAFHAPRAFGPCIGVNPVQNGLFITHQRKIQFGFSYRTKVGNDVQGLEHGYKLHLVYNALAGNSNQNFGTIDDNVSPVTFSWPITTLPPAITGYRRTAHLVIDSREADAETLATVEDILYGDESGDGRLPLPDELIAIFS